MSNFVFKSYLSGVQKSLVDAGIVKYASEEDAVVDNEALAAGIENNVPQLLEGAGAPETELDNEAIAEEGLPEEVNLPVVKAIAEMAAQVGEEAQVAKAKAEIIENAAVEMASTEKVASILVVSGQGEGTPAAQTLTGKEEQIANQVANDGDRTSPRTSPGTVADAGKGMQGSEEKVKELPVDPVANKPEQAAAQIANDGNRVHPTTAPGKEEDQGKGMQGEEVVREKISHILQYLNV